jgi:hypothetical protein
MMLNEAAGKVKKRCSPKRWLSGDGSAFRGKLKGCPGLPVPCLGHQGVDFLQTKTCFLEGAARAC